MVSAYTQASSETCRLQTGKTLQLYKGHTGPVTSLAFLKSTKSTDVLVTGSWDKSIRFWDTTVRNDILSCVTLG